VPASRGRLLLTVRSADGAVVTRRDARNQVLRNGAKLVAQLFSGQSAQPINRLQLGFATQEAAADATALTPPVPALPPAALSSPIVPGAFNIDTTPANLVRVTVNTLFTPTVPLANVSEAGLFAGNDLYNQVVFEPISLAPGQNITFFWEIEFPFGH
jgi:hypothetical protein